MLGSWTAATDLPKLDEIPDDPLDVSTLSRDPSVGEVYSGNPFVWHGPFTRPTLAAIGSGLETISAGPGLGPRSSTRPTKDEVLARTADFIDRVTA